MSLTLCELKTHNPLLFPTQKVGERTSEVQLEEIVLKMGNKVLFQATWSVLSQGESWKYSEKSKARDSYKSKLVYSALCSPHSTGNYVEMTKGRIKTFTKTRSVHAEQSCTRSRACRQFSGRKTFQSSSPTQATTNLELASRHPEAQAFQPLIRDRFWHPEMWALNNWSDNSHSYITKAHCYLFTADQAVLVTNCPKAHKHTFLCVFSEPQSTLLRLGCLNRVPCSY